MTGSWDWVWSCPLLGAASSSSIATRAAAIDPKIHGLPTSSLSGRSRSVKCFLQTTTLTLPQFYFICQSLYCPSTIPIKFSICVALLRICGTRYVFKYSLWAIMAITAVAGIGSMIGIVASCSPPSAFWDPTSGTCNASINTVAAYFISACSILTDFALAILPGLLLWNVQMKRTIKVSVGIILALAAL